MREVTNKTGDHQRVKESLHLSIRNVDIKKGKKHH
jgi:hypothetical protein